MVKLAIHGWDKTRAWTNWSGVLRKGLAYQLQIACPSLRLTERKRLARTILKGELITVVVETEKYAEALAALSGHHSGLFKLPHEKGKYTVNLLCKLNRWDEAHEQTKTLLYSHE